VAVDARSQVLADVLPGAMVRDVALVAAYAGLTGLAAQVAIPLPFTPVPITGQTFAVLLGGAALGWRRASLGMLLYVVAGLAGAPWFAQGTGGTAALTAPSFGYIIGFLFAGALVGRLAELRFDRNPALTFLAMVAGNLLIYLFGVPWLMAAVHADLATALHLGVQPFLVGDLLKALVAAGLLPTAWHLTGDH
jgi:biotin transport system substrate-specific component